MQDIVDILRDVKVHLDHPVLGDVYRAVVRRCAEVARASWKGRNSACITKFFKQYQPEPEVYTLLIQQIETIDRENRKVISFPVCQLLIY